jgi:NADPH-dependent 2,4-dienoyl-CoA reductase/sulfur reductase-like enzyme
MMRTRREFLKILGGTTLGGVLASCAPAPTPAPPTPTAAPPPTPAEVDRGVAAKALLPKPTGKRVVIIGGGIGGAMAARTLRKLAPDIEVVIIEKNSMYVSGPFHVEYPFGIGDPARFIYSFDGLRNAGVKVIRATAVEARPAEQRVITSAGYVDYSALLVATGIAMAEEQIKGLAENAHLNPHAWDWERAIHMRQAVEEFKGGVFVVSVPPAPYKCPPGPYEVACLAREYWSKKGVQAEIIVVDANDKPQPGPLADKWQTVLAERKITYKPGFKVVEFDPANKTLISDKGEKQTYDLVSIIPPQKAPDFIRNSGLGEAYIAVNPVTFASETPHVFAVGDSATGIPYTKSAFTAFLQGRNAAYHIAKALGVDVGEPETIFNQCWPYVSSGEAMLVEVHWDKEGKPIADQARTETPTANNVTLRKAWESAVLSQAYGLG